MKKFFVKYLTILFLFIIPLACEDSPSSVGETTIKDSEKLNIDSVNSISLDIEQSDSTYKGKHISHGLTARVVAGKTEDVKFFMLLRYDFFLKDSIKKIINENPFSVSKARITMRPKYKLNSYNGFPFNVYKINKSWRWQTFTYDSLATGFYDQANLTSNESFTDSTFEFDLNKDVVSEWVKEAAKRDEHKNFGAIFVPKEDVNAAWEFLVNSQADKDSSLALEMIINEKDTLTNHLIWDTHVATSLIEKFPEDKITLQAGPPVKSKIFFDILKLIPKKAAINYAKLELFNDKESSNLSSSAPSNVLVEVLADAKKDSVFNNFYGILDKEEDKFSGDVTKLVQYIINNNKNRKFRISLLDELYTSSKYVFYGNNYPDKKLRPKLTVFYTTQK